MIYDLPPCGGGARRAEGVISDYPLSHLLRKCQLPHKGELFYFLHRIFLRRSVGANIVRPP